MLEFSFTTSGSREGSDIRFLRHVNRVDLAEVIQTQSFIGSYQGSRELWHGLPIEPSSISHELCNQISEVSMRFPCPALTSPLVADAVSC
jgi:hypothetical protein